MTPFLPTFKKAVAKTAPIEESLFPAIVATWVISFLFFSSTLVARERIAVRTASAAFPIPRASAIGSAPAAIILRPSLKIPSVSTVAVVVPSPATSFVFVAASFTSCTAKFSFGSSNSISSATVTPSFVILGEPQPLSSTALRPRGPSVLRTAWVSLATPAASGCRASSSKTIFFATVDFLLNGKSVNMRESG